jgi:hypothetical protein
MYIQFEQFLYLEQEELAHEKGVSYWSLRPIKRVSDIVDSLKGR